MKTKENSGSFVGVDDRADVAAIVVTYNNAVDVPRLIDDLRAAAVDCAVRTIIVDNDSSDGTVDVVREHPDIVLVEMKRNLGYAGGINAGLERAGSCTCVLILNPDLRLHPEAVSRMCRPLGLDNRIGAVVPLMLDEFDRIYPSLRREPTLGRALGDALAGGRFRLRPGIFSETEFRLRNYRVPHDVEWATGAALAFRKSLVREVGLWDEEFFLYSEETDYFRRIRERGYRVRFEPSAVVSHRQGGSGTSPALATLMAVNRIRYVQGYHGLVFSAGFRAVVALAEALRSYDPDHRRTLGVVLDRSRWQDLPRATEKGVSGSLRRGAVIVPAYNEARVIERALKPLSDAAVAGFIELIVVCNGCSDDTAEVARAIPGVRVVEVQQASKPAALNAGDSVADLWPRMYLDADIAVSPDAVLAVLDRLNGGDVLVARPDSRYEFSGASVLVRSYYRARQRVPQHKLAMWGAGAYALSSEGHERIGTFPEVTGDDLLIDMYFGSGEKTVVPTEPAVVYTPTDVASLLSILRRNRRTRRELAGVGSGTAGNAGDTGLATALAVLRSIRGPRTAADAGVYIAMALAARWGAARSPARRWERDDSSRSLVSNRGSPGDLAQSATARAVDPPP